MLAALRCADSLSRGDELTPEQARAWLPEREEIAHVYRFVRGQGRLERTLEQFYIRPVQPALGGPRIRVALEVLRQAGLLALEEGGDSLHIRVLPAQERRI